MATIVLRSVKGSKLTSAEMDANFSNINAELITKLASSSYTAADVLTKIKTVDGAGSGLDADFLDGFSASSNGVNNTIVLRDSSGNFIANQITATLNGNASNISGVAAIANGGTGSTTAAGARAALNVEEAGSSVALSIALG